jgi:hypothetical protein
VRSAIEWPSSSEFLNKEELRELTGAARAAAQARWLAEKGVAHRRDGSRVIVSRFHVRQWLEGKHVASGGGVNWASVR